MRDCRLECVQAVIERQKRMPAEANDDRLFLDRQHRRSRFLWSRPSVHDRAARLPLAHRLLIDAVTSGERSQALFTMLYRSTDRLSRRGAPVKNLAHSASFDCTIKVRDQTPRVIRLGYVLKPQKATFLLDEDKDWTSDRPNSSRHAGPRTSRCALPRMKLGAD